MLSFLLFFKLRHVCMHCFGVIYCMSDVLYLIDVGVLNCLLCLLWLVVLSARPFRLNKDKYLIRNRNQNCIAYKNLKTIITKSISDDVTLPKTMWLTCIMPKGLLMLCGVLKVVLAQHTRRLPWSLTCRWLLPLTCPLLEEKQEKTHSLHNIL